MNENKIFGEVAGDYNPNENSDTIFSHSKVRKDFVNSSTYHRINGFIRGEPGFVTGWLHLLQSHSTKAGKQSEVYKKGMASILEYQKGGILGKIRGYQGTKMFLPEFKAIP